MNYLSNASEINPPSVCTLYTGINIFILPEIVLIVLFQDYQTPVHVAAINGHVDILRVFIKGYHANTCVVSQVSF